MPKEKKEKKFTELENEITKRKKEIWQRCFSSDRTQSIRETHAQKKAKIEIK